jgi:hypothetical protein
MHRRELMRFKINAKFSQIIQVVEFGTSYILINAHNFVNIEQIAFQSIVQWEEKAMM